MELAWTHLPALDGSEGGFSLAAWPGGFHTLVSATFASRGWSFSDRALRAVRGLWSHSLFSLSAARLLAWCIGSSVEWKSFLSRRTDVERYVGFRGAA